jgi:hypothetical protein
VGFEVWCEGAIRNQTHITAGCISKETEAKRVNMLRSVAKAMAGLQSVEFKSIGMPVFTDGESRLAH